MQSTYFKEVTGKTHENRGKRAKTAREARGLCDGPEI